MAARHKKILDIDIAAVEKIDPEAAAILSSAVSAARKIIKCRAELDKAGKHDQPLYILAGENHWQSAQRLHHVVLIEALRQQDEFMSVAYEYPFVQGSEKDLKRLLRYLGWVDEGRVSKEAWDYYLETPLGKGKLDLISNVLSTSHQSPYAMQVLSSYMFKMHIRNYGRFLAFNSDAARTPKNKLSLRDDFTKACVEDCLGAVKSGISLTSQEGMWIRNLHMVRRLRDYAEWQGARYAVQLCGQDHINGDGEECPPEQSLRAIFNDMAQPVFSVFQMADKADMAGIPAKEKNNGKAIPDYEAYYDSDVKKSEQPYRKLPEDMWPEFRTRRQEKKFIDSKLKNMGLGYLLK